MSGRTLGSWLIGLGLGLTLIGVLVWSGGLSWFGRLPGDIRIESDRSRIYIPVVSCLVLSLVLSLLVYLVRRLR